MASPQQRVCVTGGGGFIASWLVKLLLSRGYAVHATLRDPCTYLSILSSPILLLTLGDAKNAHLMQLDKARENLHLFKADVLDCKTLTPAVEGCRGVFHLATPVPEDKIIDPEASLCSLDNLADVVVHKVVVMSSNAAVTSNPNWPQDRPKDESCWSDKEFCKENEDWYSVAKLVAEQEAFEYADENGLNVVTLCPPYVFGPLLQSTVNTSSKLLIYIIKGGHDVMTNRLWDIVDVRDVVDALLLLYEKNESSGRYICSPNHIFTRDLVDLLKKMYPKYNYVDNIVDTGHKAASLSCQKLRDLGWEPRKLEETLSDSIESYENAGLLQDVAGNPCRLPPLIRMWL
ncbi:Cinnamoyl-CoA reductase 1 [Dichanthelium oligosanthes]|uniref:Cinnamoyl-CoA reductase 1 n=1 Tax=Dichanthelium oligosanthes TaxID=888268 RepID=A0A1E5UWZ2_9POAL|nr:Cinnamoyl-CoA reductase 1 [Dichanthelium oligosanthes]